jgi:hypothetical protein
MVGDLHISTAINAEDHLSILCPGSVMAEVIFAEFTGAKR